MPKHTRASNVLIKRPVLFLIFVGRFYQLGSLERAFDGFADELGPVFVSDKLIHFRKGFLAKGYLDFSHIEWWPSHALTGSLSLCLCQSRLRKYAR